MSLRTHKPVSVRGFITALLLATLISGVTAPGAHALQLVTLDFDTYTVPDDDPDDYVYAPEEKMAIKGILENMFLSDPADPEGGPFNVKFDILDPADPPAPFTTTVVKINAGAFGHAEKIDFRNLDDDDDVSVHAVHTLKLFDGAGRAPELGGGLWSVPELTAPHNVLLATAQIAAHELGHAFGLRHHDSFGPIGSGIGVATTKYAPAYPGPTGMTNASQHIMGLNSAVALNANTLLTPNHFSERSALKLALAAIEDDLGPNPFVFFESDYPIGDGHDDVSLAGETPIPLLGLPVPNTLESPHPWAPIHGGPEFLPASAAVLVGEIEDRGAGIADTDHFELVLDAPTRVTIDVHSHILSTEMSSGGRIDDWVDLNLALLDGGPGYYPLPYETGSTLTSDSFESKDPILFDVMLPAGTYVLEVFPDTPGDTGDYEILVYTYPEAEFPLVGDYNVDGVVDAADYTVARDMEGTFGPLPNRDGANTGLISSADIASWAANYGEFHPSLLDAMPALATSSVPEPASVLLLTTGLVGLGTRRR